MQETISFWINNKFYTVYDVDKIEGKDSYIGETNYENGIILIEYGTQKEMITTLKHELAHVWLYAHGYKEQLEGCFSFEDLCEIIAKSNDFINDIVRQYKSYKKIL